MTRSTVLSICIALSLSIAVNPASAMQAGDTLSISSAERIDSLVSRVANAVERGRQGGTLQAAMRAARRASPLQRERAIDRMAGILERAELTVRSRGTILGLAFRIDRLNEAPNQRLVELARSWVETDTDGSWLAVLLAVPDARPAVLRRAAELSATRLVEVTTTQTYGMALLRAIRNLGPPGLLAVSTFAESPSADPFLREYARLILGSSPNP